MFNTYRLLHTVILLVIVGFFITTLLLSVTGPKIVTLLQNVELHNDTKFPRNKTLLLKVAFPIAFNELQSVSCCCIITLLQNVVLL